MNRWLRARLADEFHAQHNKLSDQLNQLYRTHHKHLGSQRYVLLLSGSFGISLHDLLHAQLRKGLSK